MGNLPFGMDTTIRSPGTMRANGMIEYSAQYFVQLPLNRGDARLDLPAMVRGTVVGDGQSELEHRKRWPLDVAPVMMLR